MQQKILVYLVFFVFLTAGLVLPQEVPFKLDDIVVTATRVGTPLKEAPANITIITKEELEEKGVRSLVDAFSEEPGVFTNNLMGNPKFSTVDIRGYGETASQNTLFLIDGRRINNIDMSGADLSQIPIDMIERIEIYRGPASVLFGDNAIGGAINIILKQGDGKPKIKAGIYTGSYDLYNPYLSISGKEEKLSYYLLASSYDTSGYRHKNGLHSNDIAGNFSFEATKNITFDIKVNHHKDRYELPGPLTFQDLTNGLLGPKDTKTPYDTGTTEDNSVDAGVRLNFGDNVSLSLNGSYRNRHNSFFYDSGTGTFNSMRKFETYSFTPKLTLNKDIFSIKNKFAGGMDYYRNPTHSNDIGFVSSNTDIDKNEYGFYLNDEISLRKDLLLNLGYRVTKVSYDFDYRDNTGLIIKDTVWKEKDAFRVGANYIFNKDGNIFLTYATGFRFPATDEFFSPWSIPPVNQNLEPQTTKEIDLGIRWKFLKNVGGSTTIFTSKNKNEIFYNPLTFANENYDKTKRDGIEANLFYLIMEGLKLDLNYTYIKAKFDGGQFDGNNIPLVPNHKLSGKVSYILNNFTFMFVSTYVGERYLVSDQQNTSPALPGVTTFDMNVLYKYKRLSAFLGIKNLTEKQYSDYGALNVATSVRYFYPSAGRQFMFGIEYNFDK